MRIFSSGLADWTGISPKHWARSVPTMAHNQVINALANCTSQIWHGYGRGAKHNFLLSAFTSDCLVSGCSAVLLGLSGCSSQAVLFHECFQAVLRERNANL